MKIKPPKQFYTVEQLAERWECKVEDITHLIETNLLDTADKGAAREGKKNLRVRLFYDWNEFDAHDDKDEVTLPIVTPPMSEISSEETVKHEMEALVDAGEFDQVILATEVNRFEREYGQAAEDTAPPASWPWGDYETPLLRILANAVTQFCLDGPERYPKKGTDKKDPGEVVNWIKQRMETNGMPSSDHLAGAMETLIAPRPYVHHRQRKQGKP